MDRNDFDRKYLTVGRHRSFSPPAQQLATYPGASASSFYAKFRVPILNVRTRINTRILSEYETQGMPGSGDAGAPILYSAEGLWSAIRTKTPRRGAMVPLRNVVGTFAAPLVFPTDTALYGYEFTVEEVGGDDDGQVARELFGEWVGVGSVSKTAPGRTWISVTYQSVYPVTDDEWAQVVQRGAIQVFDKVTV